MLSASQDRLYRLLWSLLFGVILYHSALIDFVPKEETFNIRRVSFPIWYAISEIIGAMVPSWLNSYDIFARLTGASLNVLLLHCTLSKSVGDQFVLHKMSPSLALSLITLFLQWTSQLGAFFLVVSLFFLARDPDAYFPQIGSLAICLLSSWCGLLLLSRRLRVVLFVPINDRNVETKT